MIKEHRDGWIEVVTGVMFSGKSEELLRRVRRAMIARKSVQVFKSHLDDRYGGIGHISSHDGQEIPALPVSSSRDVAEQVERGTQVVAVDEAQFLDRGVVAVVNALADEGRRVIIAGTDMDFRGEPFGPVPALLAVAERIDKLHAICVVLAVGAATKCLRRRMIRCSLSPRFVALSERSPQIDDSTVEQAAPDTHSATSWNPRLIRSHKSAVLRAGRPEHRHAVVG
jgi:thymidine kinase